ncbi:hypothetical protein QTG54_017067 [Skeletonema marinoi]|uniref:Uncharacterized protein n=1 Tax=Skeletonema marinoi TaxID=267567 RepID=A0AAD8XRA2_9STRA|nr:hypothetical protein QTG54_017067 [Skeletonema marinoi]
MTVGGVGPSTQRQRSYMLSCWGKGGSFFVLRHHHASCSSLTTICFIWLRTDSLCFRLSFSTGINFELELSASAASNYEGIEIVARDRDRDNRTGVDPETGIRSKSVDGSTNTAISRPRRGYYGKSKYAGAVAVLLVAGTGVGIWSSMNQKKKMEENKSIATAIAATKTIKSAKSKAKAGGKPKISKSKSSKAPSSEPSNLPSAMPSLIPTESTEPSSFPSLIPTQPPTPAPTPSGPQTASYDATLGAPKCSHGLSCDSAGLLNGRGTMFNGVETNRPNNLNSCTDGGSGTYHDDESIDRIIVTRVTGGDGDLTEGDEVTITASVWCWSTGSNSFIDFYYASDASNPVWNQIVPRERCPGGGQQTMTASVVLVQGSLQAVRANFMFGSGDPGENSCTSGNYDDTDDLVISVKPNLAAQGIFATPGKSKHDDVQGQGAIVYVEKDAEADEMEKKLQQMNQSKEKPAEDDGN